MNKGSIVKLVGSFCYGQPTNLTLNKEYKVLAGQGDGVPRNDGKLGAYIQDDHTFVIEDDRGNLRVQTINSPAWELVKAAESNYVPKPEYKSPIQITTSLC